MYEYCCISEGAAAGQKDTDQSCHSGEAWTSVFTVEVPEAKIVCSRCFFLYGPSVCNVFVHIHIEGNESLSTQVVLSYLQEEGITHGMLKRQIHGEELEKKLREHFTEVTWTSAEVKGTRLIVHMKENEDASFSLVDEKEPADLVAAKSGQIISMIVRAGTPVVHEGDQVQAGDLLGYMGDSGYGPEGTTGQFPVHLHVGIYMPLGVEDELAINPYWMLKYLEEKKVKWDY